jgi:hypothetical protein
VGSAIACETAFTRHVFTVVGPPPAEPGNHQTAVTTSTMNPTFEEALRTIEALYNEGVLSETEFHAERAKIISLREEHSSADTSLEMVAKRESKFTPVASVRGSRTEMESFVVEATVVTVPGST